MNTTQIDMMQDFIQRKLILWPEFQAALIIGSVAHGEARPDSDIDCVLVFHDLNEAIVPAEFVWVRDTDAYATIFEVEATDVGGIQIDAKRLALHDFQTDGWPESFKHELSHAIVVFDRDGRVAQIMAERLAYPEALRRSRIESHLGWASYLLEEWRLLVRLQMGGIEYANDQLTTAFEEIVQLLHAYSKEWLPARHRWLISTQSLHWLPGEYSERVGKIVGNNSSDQQRLLERRNEMSKLLDDIRHRLQEDSLVSSSIESLISTHPGIGYAHNFDEWREAHQRLLNVRDTP